MKELESKEVLTIKEYAEISATLSHIFNKCSEKYGEYTLSDNDLWNFRGMRDTTDLLEQKLGTNYKEKYTDNLECLNVLIERNKKGEPNNESWEKFRRNS